MKRSWIAGIDSEEQAGRVNGTKWDDYFVGDQGDSKNVDIADVYDGRRGDDFIFGLDNGDRLYGGSGNDTIFGGHGADKIFGGSGSDTLWGGTEEDVIKGGGGADSFLFEAWSGGSDMDTILDFDPREKGERITVRTLFGEGIATFEDLKTMMVQQGDDVNIEFNAGFAMLVLKDVRIGQLDETDFHIYYA